MIRPPLAWLLAMGISLVCARAADTSPFAFNGWQFHDYNMPKLEEAVRRAPEYGVNFLIFSHEFFRSPEGFLASSFSPRPTTSIRGTRPLTSTT
ncbi:MAG: hypothetical protein M3463_15320 [Verrucomicrobiota bacterium]|nr:hypothetical protein [Verrucomicrobiota bacterium]